jgi:hypothetical protein
MDECASKADIKILKTEKQIFENHEVWQIIF